MGYTRNRDFRQTFSRGYTLNGATTNTSTSFTKTDTKSGSRVEKWKERISAGLPSGSDYARTAWRYKSEPARFSIQGYWIANGSIKRNLSGDGVISPDQSISTLPGLSNPENKALSKLYERIKEKQAGMNGMLILGELRETIKMLRRPGEGLLNLFSDYLGTAKGLRQEFSRRKGGGNRKRFTKAISDLWLEYSFGWKPLISDVRDIATTVARIANDNALRTDRAIASASDSKAECEPAYVFEDIYGGSVGPGFWNHRTRKSELGVRYVAGINASTYGPVDSFSALARETGFTLDNFVPTVWNLIPYSFLVDYFVNIGDCIEAVFTDTSSVRWYSKTVRAIDETILLSRFDIYKTAAIWQAGGYNPVTWTNSDGMVHIIRTTLNRTVGTVLPIPALQLSMPSIDSSKWWNMLALWQGKAAGARM